MQPPWTADAVGRALIDAFGIRSGALAHSPGEVERALNWRRRFLADDPRAWAYLMAWGRCRASGESVEAHRRAMGWSPKRFQIGRRRAARRIADGLNREASPSRP